MIQKLCPQWPPNYTEEFRQRQLRLKKLRANVPGAKAYYSTRPVEFIEHFVVTFDPRNAGSGDPATMPFILFPRQVEFIEWLELLVRNEQSGLCEKSRDMGASWLCCAFAVWLFLFWDGASIGFGSAKENKVDKIGDTDSLFEKIRIIIRNLPRELLPDGFREKDHMSFMKFVNPENGATITGDAGDNIGRGGRSLLVFKDESGHYERPEKIEAALSENTRVQIDISSVNGTGNVFHRRREAGHDYIVGEDLKPGRTSVFVFDWRDHPAKTDEWYQERKAKFESEGMAHVFAQEVDRNYAAAVEGIIIRPEWVDAAVDAHLALGHIGTWNDGQWGGALDVADEGLDVNAVAMRKGSILKSAVQWGERDTGVTTRRAIDACRAYAPLELQYDCIGIGAGVKSEFNRLNDDSLIPSGLRFVPWNAGAKVLNPDDPVIELSDGEDDQDSPLNKDFYSNLKAQGWWELARRFERTYRAVNEKIPYDVDDMISIDGTIPELLQIKKELSQPTRKQDSRLRMMVDKTPAGTRSPNLADAIMMAFWPVPTNDSVVRVIRF